MTTPEQIDVWRQVPGESQTIEFKEAKTQFDVRRLYEYCVAIANEGGGHLILGVNNNPPRSVVGSEAFKNPVKVAAQLFDKLKFRVEVKEVRHPDGRVVVFSIPGRPHGTAFDLDGRYLMRSGDQLVSMTEDRLRSIFDEGKPDWLEETSCGGMSGQDVIDSLDTQTFFELFKEPFPTNTTAILDRLVTERLIDRMDDRYSVRRLGGLLLSRRIADYPDLSRKAPRVVVYSGSSKVETKRDQVGVMGYAVGFQRLCSFVMSQLPQNEVVKDAIREEVKLVPEITIRELVANALIHQDVAMTGTSVMVEVYDNRVEISNPGIPIVPVERFIDGYQSRNERMANIMRRLGICEEKGSGIDRVIHAAEMYQLPAPDFRIGQGRTTVIVFGPKPFDDMDRDKRIRACYQHAGLKRVMSEYLTNQSLRERFKLPEAKSAIVSQIISATVEAGLIKPDKSVGTSRKLARYLPYWA